MSQKKVVFDILIESRLLMNKENKQKQQLVAQTVQQLIQFGKDPENKHFAYIGVDGDLYEAELPNSGNVVLSGNMGLLAHVLFEQRDMIPYELRVHMLAHILVEDTDLVVDAHNLIKDGKFPEE